MADPIITPAIQDYIAKRQALIASLPLPSMAGPQMAQSALPSIPLPSAPSVAPSQLLGDQNERSRLLATGSGVSQIHNPFLHGLAKFGDILGTTAAAINPVARVLVASTPGTTLHHNMLVNDQDRRIANDQAQAKESADLANVQATTRHTNDAASALENPTDKYTPIQTDDGLAAFNAATGTATAVSDGNGGVFGKPVAPPKTLTPEEDAYHSAVAGGTNPMDAFRSLYQAKNTKDATIQQQFLDGYKKAHPGVSDTDAIAATIRATRTDPQITILNAGAANRAAAAGSGFPSGSGSGEASLANLSPQQAQVVKSTAAGDIAMPPPGSRAPGAQALRQAVLAYDPTYTDARYKGKQMFKTGGDADKVVSLTTTMDHAQNALDNSAKNGFSPLLSFNATAGDAAYNKDAQFLTGELGKLVEGKALTQGEHDQLIQGLNSSRQSIRDASIKESLALLSGKVQGVFQKYKTATGEDIPVDKFFDQATQDRLQKYGITNNAPSRSNSGLAVSLSDARNLPQNKGKSDADIRADIQAHGHTVRD